MLLRAFAFFLAIAVSATFFWSGYEWLYSGYGLNPWIAFPIATLLYFIPWFMLHREAEAAEIAIEDYLEWLDSRQEAMEEMAQIQRERIDEGLGNPIELRWVENIILLMKRTREMLNG